MNNSIVLEEFLKIAEEKDLFGIKKTATPSPNPHQEDKRVIEEKRQKSPEKNIIEQAHPESVYVAEARGDGGLVENQIEQQNKLIEMLNKMPTGSLVGRYAHAINELVKVADRLDDIGESNLSDVVYDKAIVLFEKIDDLPFEKAPGK
jgi:hypothetical protein